MAVVRRSIEVLTSLFELSDCRRSALHRISQPTKFDFVQTGKTLGLTAGAGLLATVDEVIDLRTTSVIGAFRNSIPRPLMSIIGVKAEICFRVQDMTTRPARQGRQIRTLHRVRFG